MKQLIEKYNTPETLLVLTSFSDTKRGDLSAIDRYSEKKIADIAKNRKVVICAEKLSDHDRSFYEYKKNIFIARIWKKGNILSFFPLLAFVRRLHYVSTILVEFEFNVFGGTIPNFMLLSILLLAKLSGKRIIFELHQVITDISKLDKHLNVTNPVMQKILSFGLFCYYKLIGVAADSIIVLEEELKKRLKKIVEEKKIVVLPHHMNVKKPINKEYARTRIGISKNEFVVLVFGYINWYKGVDWIAKASKLWKGKNIRLLIAGGPNPYHINKEYYKNYYNTFLDTVKKEKHILYTGFVADKDIGLYYSAADIAVLPYRVFMAASGPYSLALSYGVPTILSSKLKNYSESEDFKDALKITQLTKKDVFFELSEKSLYKILSKVKTNTKYSSKLTEFSNVLAKSRTHQNVMDKLHNILFPSKSISSLKMLPKAQLALQS